MFVYVGHEDDDVRAVADDASRRVTRRDVKPEVAAVSFAVQLSPSAHDSSLLVDLERKSTRVTGAVVITAAGQLTS